MGFIYAVVGATGNVGREILQILAERSVPSSEVIAIASSASKGIEVPYGDDAVYRKQDHFHECCMERMSMHAR